MKVDIIIEIFLGEKDYLFIREVKEGGSVFRR